jgi:hypothetical protein
MQKQPLLVIGIFCFLLILSSAIMGAASLMVTDLGTSARMIGMGNIEGFSYAADAIFENPAALYPIKNLSFSAFSTKIIGEVDFINMAGAYHTDLGVVALGYMQAGVNDIPHTYVLPSGKYDVDYNFGYRTYLAKLAYALSINDYFHLGSALNYYGTEIDSYTGKGLNADLGLIFTNNDLDVAFNIKNFLGFAKAQYSDSKNSAYRAEESYPIQTALAIKYRFYDVEILSQLKRCSHQPRTLSALGLHYQPNLMPFFHFYGGYKEFFALAKVMNVHTIGFGLSLFGLEFNYAYERSDHFEYDNNYYFSLVLNM